jgi:nitrate reductase beta subunit
MMLYDADRIEEIAKSPDDQLVEAQRSMIMDPFDPEVIASAKKNGISDAVIAAAQKSPVYKFVKEWQIALPLHPEFRTLPMLFYVPPMLPVLAGMKDGKYEVSDADTVSLAPLLSSLERARMPIKFMASLFSAGNVDIVNAVYRKLIGVRLYQRNQQVKDLSDAEAAEALSKANMSEEEAGAIYRLTALPTYDERFVIPPMAREQALDETAGSYNQKREGGFGPRKAPARRF